ncbi:MAG: helix-turn-helix domain-containing protein [Clostridia bacterium]
MAIDYTVIGERLKKARKAKKLTQEDLAEQLDVSIAFLSRIERGSSQVNLKRLTQICEILEISEGDILNGVSSKSNKYLDSEFADLLKNCSSEKQKLIYDVAKVIAGNKE